MFWRVIMKHKIEKRGFKQVKKTVGSHHVYINQYGNITFSNSLIREITLRRTHNAVLYFNEDDNILGIHVGVFDLKKDRDLDITIIQDEVIMARELIEHIEDEQEIKLFPVGEEKRRLEVTEVEDMARNSKMILVELPERTQKRSFRR